jgi:hypothetical protein
VSSSQCFGIVQSQMVVVSKVLESDATIACKNLLFLFFVHVFVVSLLVVCVKQV